MNKFFTIITLSLFSLLAMGTEKDVTVAADSHIQGGSSKADVNFGGESLLYVKHNASTSFTRKALLKFDLSDPSLIPSGEVITSAKLKLTLEYVDRSGIPIQAFAIADDSWMENNVTWNNAPEMGVAVSAIYATASKDVPVEIELDLSEYVLNEMLNDANKIVSVYIFYGVIDNHIKISSKEGSVKPVLSITSGMVSAPNKPTAVSASPVSAQVLNLSWMDNSEDELGSKIERKKGAGAFEEIAVVSADITTYQDYYLDAASEYTYRIKAYNGAGDSDYSDLESLTMPTLAKVTYYIDATDGKDINDGKSEATAWASPKHISSMPFSAGTSFLFKRGEVWNGVEIALECNSSEGYPTIIGAYGAGAKPILNGTSYTQSKTLHLHNIPFIEVSDLEIRNSGGEGKAKLGVYITAEDFGVVDHVHLKNLKINKIFSVNNDTYKNYGGVYFEVLKGKEEITWFNDILVEGCEFDSLARTGLSLSSFYDDRSLDSEFGDAVGTGTYVDNFVPSTNVVIRDNRFTNIQGNGLIWRVSDKPLIEHNYFYNCAYQISGNAMFVFSTDSALIQYNEACYTPWMVGETDARGIDADYRTKATIIQHNYLHHNGYGGVVATGGPNNSSLPTFNDGTIIRFNILVDNEDHDFRGSGQLTNLFMYNNTILSTADCGASKIFVKNGVWGDGVPDGCNFANNILKYENGSTEVIDAGPSTNNQFSNNCYDGFVAFSLPTSDLAKVTSDPGFTAGTDVDVVGTKKWADITNETSGFSLNTTSSCLAKGTTSSSFINGLPSTDFFGNTLPTTLNIGAYQGSGTDDPILGLADVRKDINEEVRLFPNPSTYFVNVNLTSAYSGKLVCQIYSIDGKLLHSENVEVSGQHSFPIYLYDNGIGQGTYIMSLTTPEARYSKTLKVK